MATPHFVNRENMIADSEYIQWLSDVKKRFRQSQGRQLYGVETRIINQAVKNNPNKFPDGYLLKLDNKEVADLRSKILISSWGGRRSAPTAFTESGLYMLATILKSDRAA